ncbi:NAD(P)-binding protein [Aspergillus crustosus]
MPSYVVTGASRNLGLEFVRQLSQADPENIVIGLVRDKAAAEKRFRREGLSNVHAVEAQYTDLASLKKAAEEVKRITGGGLNWLINNAAILGEATGFKGLSTNFSALEADLRDTFEVNVLGIIKTIEAFTPLLRAATGEKKVISLSTGMADLDLINATRLTFAAPYAISKAALNAVVAKYNAALADEGILFLAVSPGYVATEAHFKEKTPEEEEGGKVMGAIFAQHAPHFKRPLTPEESITAVLKVSREASLEKGDGGAFISHLGNKQWL